MRTYVADDVRDRFLRLGVRVQDVYAAVKGGRVVTATTDSMTFEVAMRGKKLRVDAVVARIEGARVLNVLRVYWQK